MTPAEEQIRAALEAGPTLGPWRFSSHPHDGNYMRITCSSDPAEGDNLRGYCGESNARFIAACNPAAVAELLAELDGERNRSQMFADLVRGVAVVLHGEGWSDTSKLAQEVEALKTDAARYRLLRRGQRWSIINGIGDELRAETLDAAIDAAKGGGNG